MEFQDKLSTPNINDKEFVKYIEENNLIVNPIFKKKKIPIQFKNKILWLKYKMEIFLSGIMEYRDKLHKELSDEERELNDLIKEKVEYTSNLNDYQPGSDKLKRLDELYKKIISKKF